MSFTMICGAVIAVLILAGVIWMWAEVRNTPIAPSDDYDPWGTGL
jgi:hypothetical protein